jgi:hypothetical protein
MVFLPLSKGAESVKEVQVVVSGTALSSSYHVEYMLTPGTPMVVTPGKFDIVLAAGGGSFLLTHDVEVKEQTLAKIDPNAILGTILVDPLTRPGFPEIKKLVVFAADTAGSSSRTILQSADRLGVSLPIPPGKYDVRGETADGNHPALAKNIEVKARQETRIRTDQEVAQIVVHQMNGVQLKMIYVFWAGQRLIAAQTKEFERPMLVHQGEAYDVELQQTGGSAQLKKGLIPKPGQIVELP